jgi:hypothetical protein
MLIRTCREQQERCDQIAERKPDDVKRERDQMEEIQGDTTWKWRFRQELNAQEKPETAHMARKPR